MTKQVIICATCGANSDALAEAVRGVIADDWQIVRQECMSMCESPVALAVQGTGRATYLFAGLTPEDASDVAAFTRIYEDADKGWIEDARPAGRLRFCLKGRVPALTA